MQNGEAPEPPDTGDISGFEFDAPTLFLYIDFTDALRALGYQGSGNSTTQPSGF